jgi:hypothetical protein
MSTSTNQPMSTSTPSMEECKRGTGRDQCDVNSHRSASVLPSPLLPDLIPTTEGQCDRDGLARLEQAYAGDEDAMRSVVADVHRCVADRARGVSESMERYLGIPNTRARLRLYLRNSALARAAPEIDAPAGIWSGCQTLAHQWHIFVTRGLWDRTKHLSSPPADFSTLRRHLWVATLHQHPHPPLSANRLLELRHLFGVWAK